MYHPIAAVGAAKQGERIMVSKKGAIIAVIVVVALVASGVFVFTGMNNGKAKDSGTIVITDALSNNVTLSSTPLRVVSASPSTTELLYAMGVNGSLVGVTDYCDYPLNSEGRSPKDIFTSIGGFYSPNFETIAGLKPDLVLLDAGVLKQKDLMTQLDSVNIKYVTLFTGKSITEIKNNIELLGKIFDKASTSASIISDMDAKFSAITTTIGNVTDKPKVMVMVGFSPDIWVNGGNTFINDIIVASGGVNVFANSSSYASISKEGVVEADPDIIIVTASMIPGLTPQQVLDELGSDPILGGLDAVKNHKVYVLQDDAEGCFLRSATRVTQATQILADILYPTAFDVTIPNILGDSYQQYLPASWSTGTTARTVMTPAA
jgi:iron complex transport system substrate-binding protein